MSNKTQRNKVNKAVHGAKLLAIHSHPATTLVKLLIRIGLPVKIARTIAVAIFPSIKRIL